MKINSIKIILYFSVLLVFAAFSGCANQQPPSGGDDDKVPPRIKYLYPRPNTVNFSGNEVTIEFDEYVDRRSFIDAFFVSPRPKGDPDFNWSGKEVTVKYKEGFEKNKTYLFVIGKLFKDIRNNYISEPIQFAISTGPSIDKGKVSGKVFGNSFEKEFVYAYKLTQGSEKDPSKDYPDFIMPVSNDGNYRFENLSYGNYRFFVVFDNDRNGLYDKEFEYISVTEKDAEVKDTIPNTGFNFILKDELLPADFYSSKEFYKSLLPDTTGTVFSNITDGDKSIGMLSRYYFYFKNHTVTKDDVSRTSVMQDTLGNKIRLVYNWMNDTLLEVIPVSGLYSNAPLSFAFKYTKSGSERKYKLNFTIADERKTGEIKGLIADKYRFESPVVVNLINKNKRELNYSRTLTTDSTFSFPGLYEGTYYLIAFIDSDGDGKYTSGNYYPYKPSEKIIVYSTVLNLKGGWNIENVVLNF